MPMKPVQKQGLALVALAALVTPIACSPGQTPPAGGAPATGAPAAGAASGAAAPPAGGEAGKPGAVIICRANFDYVVEVDGAYPHDPRFLGCDARGKYLVDLPSQSKSLLVDLSSRRVTTVRPGTIDRSDDTGLVRFVDPGPTGAPAYALAIDGSVLRFLTDNSKVRVLSVLEREPIVGPVALDALLADRAEYREAMKAYRPNLDAVATIHKVKEPITIEAYFATWCPHCKMFMPKFLRVMQDAANPAIRLTLVGVPKGFGAIDGPWKGKNITGIPTIIVSSKGSEMARIDSHENAVPETDLASILGVLK